MRRPSLFDLADFQQYLERPVDYWRDFGRRCAVHLQQKTIIPFRPGEMERLATRVLARMAAETGLQLSPERAQAKASGMQETLRLDEGTVTISENHYHIHVTLPVTLSPTSENEGDQAISH